MSHPLAEHGYVLLPGLLTGAEVATFRGRVDQLLADGPAEACKRPHNTLVPLRWDDPLIHTALAGGARRRRLARALAADDLRWISAYLSIKEPHSPPLWWHQDWWCWQHPLSFQRHAAQIAVACYLDDTTEDNGALRLLPGTHRRSHPLHALLPEAHGSDSAALDRDHPALADQPEQVTAELTAGDAVAMDYRLLHATHANTTGARRVCVLLNFAPSWAHLPEDLRAHLISHPALPAPDETVTAPARRWLPSHAGARRDLPLDRHAPAVFEVATGAKRT